MIWRSSSPWTGEADESFQQISATPGGNPPTQSGSLARPGAFALGFHTGIQFEGGQIPWKQIEEQSMLQVLKQPRFLRFSSFFYLFRCPCHFQLSHFLSLDVWWFLALFLIFLLSLLLLHLLLHHKRVIQEEKHQRHHALIYMHL